MWVLGHREAARSTMGGGTGAPPQPHARRVDMSWTAGSKASRAIWTNGAAVTVLAQPYSLMRARPTAGSHTSSRWVEVADTIGMPRPTAIPVAWVTGVGWHVVSPGSALRSWDSPCR